MKIFIIFLSISLNLAKAKIVEIHCNSHYVKILSSCETENVVIDKMDQVKIIGVIGYPIDKLVIRQSELTDINPFILKNYPNLRLLSIDSPLERISADSLEYCSNLEVLELYLNNIFELKNETFRNCTNLEKLAIQNSLLFTIELNAFKELKNLRNLFLVIGNLSSLEIGIFDNLEVLTDLNLEFNKLTFIDLELFRNNKNLSWINLSNNRLKSISGNQTFNSLPRLMTLHLKMNELEEIDILRIPVIDVSNNKLKAIYLTREMITVSANSNSIRKLSCDTDNLSMESLDIAKNFLNETSNCFAQMNNIATLNIIFNDGINEAFYENYVLNNTVSFEKLMSLFIDSFKSYDKLSERFYQLYEIRLSTKGLNCDQFSKIHEKFKCQNVAVRWIKTENETEIENCNNHELEFLGNFVG